MDRYVNVIIKMKKLCNMKVRVVPIIARKLGAIKKSKMKTLKELEIRRRIQIIQTNALLKEARILSKFMRTIY